MKKNKFKGNNAKIVEGTRLTQRQMKKMAAAYHNAERDLRARQLEEANNLARVTEDVKPADLGDVA